MLKRLIPSPIRRKLSDRLFKTMKPRFDRYFERYLLPDMLRDKGFLEKLKFKLELLDLEREEFRDAEVSPSRNALLETASRAVKVPGLWMEFGVSTGRSVNFIAKTTKNTVYGFDSFEGLPEDWVKGRSKVIEKGSMNQNHVFPESEPNVTFVKGWFENSLPAFIKEHPEPAAFVHIDSDLYSSAKCIFEHVKFQAGTVIVFDEYFNYPFWKEHEYKAFKEFLAVHPFTPRCLAYFPGDKQAVFVLEAAGKTG